MKVRTEPHGSILFFLAIVLFVSFVPLHLMQAQGISTGIESRDVQLSLDPSTPGTNERVEVSLDSLVVNVNRFRITWFVDGELYASEIGLTEIEVTTKNQGEATRVEAYVQIDDETNLRKWIQIVPADLDILWQADTYTPPFYRGKALPTPESHIIVVGLPNIRNAGINNDTLDLLFDWRHNGDRVPDSSGYGRNTLVIRNDFLKLEERISLTATHIDGFSRAETNTTIDIREPQLVIYDTDNYLRRGNRQVNLLENDVKRFVVEPYYFSARRELLNLLQPTWRINTDTVEGDQNSKAIDLLARGDGSGAAEISVSISHPLKPLQTTEAAQLTVIQ